MDRYNQDSKSNTSFERVTSSQAIESLAELAQEIWDEHYTPIIGKDQVNYMLENLHSTEKLTQEINIENHEYFLIKSDNKIIGYLGYQIKKDGIFLNRLYLHQTKRGLGIGRKAIELRRFAGQWVPYVRVRYDLWARLNRSQYVQWVELALERQEKVASSNLELVSNGYVFEVAR